MAQDCWDWSNDGFKHFPRGTYTEQMSTALGRAELECIRLIVRVQRALARKKRNWKVQSNDEFKKEQKKADKKLLDALEAIDL